MSHIRSFGTVATRPKHVPEHLVYDFDMFCDPDYLNNPHDAVIRIIAEAPPVFWTPRNGGHWMAVSYDANSKAFRNFELFSSRFMTREQLDAIGDTLPGRPHIPMATPIHMDPPEHSKFRAPLQKVFSPKAVMAMKDDIRAVADRIFSDLVGSGRCEFQSAVSSRFPVEVFLKMFGLPLSLQDKYLAIAREHLSYAGSDPIRTMINQVTITEIMRGIILERRDRPREDIISGLWQAKIDDNPMTLETMEDYSVLLFVAGLETVSNAIGFGVRHLALDPDLQDKLRANSELIGEATEEILRRFTFTVASRTVVADTVWEGVSLRAGERLKLFLPAASLDPAVYPEPEKFRLGRTNSGHIAFGIGPHHCLGSHLARLELQVLYEEMLFRLPTWRLDPEFPPSYHGGKFMGPTTLHIRWDHL